MGIFDQFIENVDEQPDSLSFQILDTSAESPIKWGGIASAIGGSIAAGAASGAIGIFNGIGDAVEMIFSGASGAVEDLVAAFFEPFVSVPLGLDTGDSELYDLLSPKFADRAAAQIWGIAYVDEFGLFAGPAAVAFVLVAAYLVTAGARQAIETFQEGGGIL